MHRSSSLPHVWSAPLVRVEPSPTPDVEHTEDELVLRALADREAFTALYRANVQGVVDYLGRRLGDEDAAHDLTAEVFLRALRHLPRYRRAGIPFRHWLLRIASNLANNWQRRRAWQRALSFAEAESTVAAEPVDDGRARADALRRALARLSSRHQSVLTLHYLEGLGVEEIARLLRCRPGTVKSRLARGRDELRARLAHDEVDDERSR